MSETTALGVLVFSIAIIVVVTFTATLLWAAHRVARAFEHAINTMADDPYLEGRVTMAAWTKSMQYYVVDSLLRRPFRKPPVL